jgi:hypothetical protein
MLAISKIAVRTSNIAICLPSANLNLCSCWQLLSSPQPLLILWHYADSNVMEMYRLVMPSINWLVKSIYSICAMSWGVQHTKVTLLWFQLDLLLYSSLSSWKFFFLVC